jgi:hypothetical protein
MISGAVENNLASMNKPVRLTSSSVTSTKVAKGYQRSNAVEQKNTLRPRYIKMSAGAPDSSKKNQKPIEVPQQQSYQQHTVSTHPNFSDYTSSFSNPTNVPQ